MTSEKTLQEKMTELIEREVSKIERGWKEMESLNGGDICDITTSSITLGSIAKEHGINFITYYQRLKKLPSLYKNKFSLN